MRKVVLLDYVFVMITGFAMPNKIVSYLWLQVLIIANIFIGA